MPERQGEIEEKFSLLVKGRKDNRGRETMHFRITYVVFWQHNALSSAISVYSRQRRARYLYRGEDVEPWTSQLAFLPFLAGSTLRNTKHTVVFDRKITSNSRQNWKQKQPVFRQAARRRFCREFSPLTSTRVLPRTVLSAASLDPSSFFGTFQILFPALRKLFFTLKIRVTFRHLNSVRFVKILYSRISSASRNRARPTLSVDELIQETTRDTVVRF